MQIVSGRFRGRKLVAPKTEGTRPTLAKVKESVFDILQKDIEGACVLDLFAGSGAYSAEAVSRGAAKIVAVEHAPEALKAMKINLRNMENCEIIEFDYIRALNRLKNKKERFDLIFIDPPYESTFGFEALRLIAKFGLLKEEGMIIFEMGAGKEKPVPKSFVVMDERRYGTVVVLFLKLQQNNS